MYATNTYDVTDAYKDIALFSKNASITVEPSEDGCTRVVFIEKKRPILQLSVQGETLTVRQGKAKWYDFLKVGIRRSEIKLFVPASTPRSLSVRSSVGQIDIRSISCAENLNIVTSTAKTVLDNVTAQSIDVKGGTGQILLNSIVVGGQIHLKSNTGQISLSDCSAPEILVKANTGSVSGKLPSGTVFIARSNTGNVKLPKAELGDVIRGRCEVKTNTGNIRFE